MLICAVGENNKVPYYRAIQCPSIVTFGSTRGSKKSQDTGSVGDIKTIV